MPSWQVRPRETFEHLVNDFTSTWEGIAAQKNPIGRGNFLFGLMATVLLEWACRLCGHDQSGQALRQLSDALHNVRPEYFTPLPQGISSKYIAAHGRASDFQLPRPDRGIGPPLLWTLFDLIRNGQAHQYQQIPAHLGDEHYLWISIKGSEPGTTLTAALPSRASDHLAFCEYRDGNIGIRVRADVFFLDICAAIEQSGMLDRGLQYGYLRRNYGITKSELMTSLKEAGHVTFTE